MKKSNSRRPPFGRRHRERHHFRRRQLRQPEDQRQGYPVQQQRHQHRRPCRRSPATTKYSVQVEDGKIKLREMAGDTVGEVVNLAGAAGGDHRVHTRRRYGHRSAARPGFDLLKPHVVFDPALASNHRLVRPGRRPRSEDRRRRHRAAAPAPLAAG
ncbi:MAG: hypothetical protein MZV64_15885 [Ignavibacteriales bacterium]|nr:hypothetical protein [Ignavibacteriales bacterium]